MSTYVFKAIDLTGGKARGEVEAESKQAVSDQLKQRGLIVLDISDKHSSREIELAFLKRVKANDLAIFSRQLSTMISSGMSILRSLYVLEEQTESKFLKETIVAVRKDVEAGLSLSDSMARHPKVFSPLFVAMTQAGETGGVLEDALMRVADQLQKDAALRRQIKSAMVYPVMVDHLRRRRDDGPRRLPGAGLRRRLQAVRRRTAQADAGLGVPLGNRSPATGG